MIGLPTENIVFDRWSLLAAVSFVRYLKTVIFQNG
jgi:hypothetical protein